MAAVFREGRQRPAGWPGGAPRQNREDERSGKPPCPAGAKPTGPQCRGHVAGRASPPRLAPPLAFPAGRGSFARRIPHRVRSRFRCPALALATMPWKYPPGVVRKCAGSLVETMAMACRRATKRAVHVADVHGHLVEPVRERARVERAGEAVEEPSRHEVLAVRESRRVLVTAPRIDAPEISRHRQRRAEVRRRNVTDVGAAAHLR